MKKIFIVIIALSVMLPGASWREQTKKIFLSSEKPDFSKIIEILNGSNVGENPEDMKCRNLLMAFSYMKKEEKNKEIFWIKEFFENNAKLKDDLSMFGDMAGIEIEAFVETWKNNYPKVIDVRLRKTEYSYKKYPKKLKALLSMSNECRYELINTSDRKYGTLKKGVNILEFSEGENKLKVSLGNVRVEKVLEVVKEIVLPESLEILNEEFHLKEKKEKEEYKVVNKTEIKTDFDKAMFRKKSLVPGAIGVGALLLNRLFIAKERDKNAFMRGASISVDIVSVALILKGIKGYFDSRSKRKVERKVKESVPGSRNYNRYIRRILEKEKKKVKVVYKMIMENVK